ncbi:MAG: hypothetical protein ACR2Q4_10385, partial [Geminicoccaceae bacterium]
MLCVVVLMAAAMLATALVIAAAGDRKASLLAAAEDRLEATSRGRAQVLKTWIQGKLSASRRLTESELVRLFVTDVDLFPAGKPLPRSIRDQRP